MAYYDEEVVCEITAKCFVPPTRAIYDENDELMGLYCGLHAYELLKKLNESESKEEE